jgi:hypothetical protein
MRVGSYYGLPATRKQPRRRPCCPRGVMVCSCVVCGAVVEQRTQPPAAEVSLGHESMTIKSVTLDVI